jgi:glutamate/tyrosine decarboxylase-like PLP-dependent enzyme
VTELDRLLDETRKLALTYLESLETRDVASDVDRDTLRDALGGEMRDEPSDAVEVIRDLARGVEPGLVATSGGRFFGFVEGGVLPVALAADWLTSTWDQNPGFYALSPAAAVVEEIAAGWLLDVLGLPRTASVGFTSGAQMANLVGLAAARHHILAKQGWDVEADGLQDAPPISVIVGEERHATIGRALRFLGLGEKRVTVVAADEQGRMRPSELGSALGAHPAIVCAQAGNVNTGAFDPMGAIVEVAHEQDAWVHVDGAFGLWAAASPQLRHLVDGVELADSWATDGHKWLNVPYDSGIAFCAHPDAHSTAMALTAPYLVRSPNASRNGTDWTPESSRRARAFTIWAALRGLGRSGIAEMVESCCAHARRFAGSLGSKPGFEVLNDVALNQVLLRIVDDETTKRVARQVQAGGAAWLADTVWQGQSAIRISVSDHITEEADVDRAIDEIVRAAASIA